jgi:hypothetical protein
MRKHAFQISLAFLVVCLPRARRSFKLRSGAKAPRVRDGFSTSRPRAGMGRRKIALPTETLLSSPLEASKPVFVSPSGADLPAVVLLAIHLPSDEQVVARPDNPHFARVAQDEGRSDCAKLTWRKRSETAIKESKDQLDEPSAKSAKR